jgi:hypothetical protein
MKPIAITRLSDGKHNADALECLKALLKDAEESSQGVSARLAIKPNKWQTARLARIANARAIINKAEGRA